MYCIRNEDIKHTHTSSYDNTHTRVNGLIVVCIVDVRDHKRNHTCGPLEGKGFAPKLSADSGKLKTFGGCRSGHVTVYRRGGLK